MTRIMLGENQPITFNQFFGWPNYISRQAIYPCWSNETDVMIIHLSDLTARSRSQNIVRFEHRVVICSYMPSETLSGIRYSYFILIGILSWSDDNVWFVHTVWYSVIEVQVNCSSSKREVNHITCVSYR